MLTYNLAPVKHIIIIGGGFAGAYCARKLEKNFHVTLIDTKDYYEFTPGILRTIVEPQHVRKIQRLHTHYLHKTKVMRGMVTSITKKDVVFNGHKIFYDYLIIASGSTYHSPIKEQNIVIATRGAILRDYYEHLCKAHSILIIGGGIVGVELAAEIVTHYPGKKVTLVHAHEYLMERMPRKAQTYAKEFLEAQSVKFIMNERITEHTRKSFITNNGTKIQADLTFICTGIKPNSDFMNKHFSELLNEKQFIMNDAWLRLQGYDYIFVGGDVTAVKEEKTAQNAENHAKIIVKNICHQEQGKELTPYRQNPRAMVISLGKYNGIFTYKNMVIKGIIPGILKTLIEWKTMMRY